MTWKKDAGSQCGQGSQIYEEQASVTLEYYEVFETKEEAMRRECAIKRMTPRTETGIACRTFTIILLFNSLAGGHPFVKRMFYFADFRDIIRCFDQIGTGSLTG